MSATLRSIPVALCEHFHSLTAPLHSSPARGQAFARLWLGPQSLPAVAAARGPYRAGNMLGSALCELQVPVPPEKTEDEHRVLKQGLWEGEAQGWNWQGHCGGTR